ncbi:hypothetical protein KJ750_02975 [Patescibacteria group bacterium]|nr:hypothetical protein [Patescibacteria group bacterium]
MEKGEKGINRECPICGNEKQTRHLICTNCFQVYTGEAGHSLARDGKIPSFTVWAYERIEKRLGELKNHLAQKKDEYISLQEQVRADAYTVITDSLKGKKISTEIFKNALGEKKKEVWKARKGNHLHYELKSIESNIVFLQGLKDELQTKIQSFESRSASDVPILLPQAV